MATVVAIFVDPNSITITTVSSVVTIGMPLSPKQYLQLVQYLLK